jgi:hypothetical protein
MEAIHPWTWKELLVFSYYQWHGRPSWKCQQQSQIWCMQFKNASLLKTWIVTRIAISSNKFQIANVSDLISTSLALCFSRLSCGVVEFPKTWSFYAHFIFVRKHILLDLPIFWGNSIYPQSQLHVWGCIWRFWKWLIQISTKTYQGPLELIEVIHRLIRFESSKL